MQEWPLAWMPIISTFSRKNPIRPVNTLRRLRRRSIRDPRKLIATSCRAEHGFPDPPTPQEPSHRPGHGNPTAAPGPPAQTTRTHLPLAGSANTRTPQA
jgi:hypothetical protein